MSNNLGIARLHEHRTARGLTPSSRGPLPWDFLEDLAKHGQITDADVLATRASARQTGASLEGVLHQEGLASPGLIAEAMARVEAVQRANLSAYPPSPRLLDRYGATDALRTGCVPWRRAGRETLIVAKSAAAFDAERDRLSALFGPCRLAIATQDEIAQVVTQQRRGTLARLAETRLPSAESCRTLFGRGWQTLGYALAAALTLALIVAPAGLFTGLVLWAVLTLVATTSLKLAASILALRRGLGLGRQKAEAPDLSGLSIDQLPKISLLVPLYQETQIAQHLLERLKKLDYPRDRLDVILVTESEDLTTRDTLAATELPHWFRQVSVPPGRVKTKPRALNYALDHCRGTIVGVYDAEDAPEPEQLRVIAAEFARAAPEVACLQGRLDYYNPHQNWFARCFTMEYAAWFRVMLPGLEGMRLPVPLGGTTLFFRRAALEHLKGWDAYNVTEDADLGLRLARHGYRTKLVDTVTYEEANCRAWPWVRQRSRWLKGYAVTYAVHMRAPVRLWRDLGARGFLGVQVLFACTLSQFLLAPVLWTFWLIPFGVAHPLLDVMSVAAVWSMAGFFFLSELIGLAVVALGLAQTRHKGLLPWAVTLTAYFPLGTVAVYKAVWELFGRPYFWDKTSHGVSISPAE